MKFTDVLFLSLALFTGHSARADIPSVHGMFVFGGEKATYASHLPMFHAPHDRQLILKVQFVELPRSETVKIYETAKKSGRKFFTLEPKVMDLEKIASGAQTSFVSKIYDGHFERGGHSLGSVQVFVQKVVFSSKFGIELSGEEKGNYLVFGEQGEYFAAHLIESKPSFDAILEVGQPFSLFVPSCRTRKCAEPVKSPVPDSDLPLTISGPLSLAEASSPDARQLGGLQEVITDVKSLLYGEEGDLSH